ncbi:serine hydrolase [Anthocerotibacter panamensis]|uniref:serine hydrolase n=1 Tax=Anthocerotibacter panamensis TaxID=2857077 RepID=UPI001C4018CF|nr:serine hydrolase [Anthocerotibacter panamensis]
MTSFPPNVAIGQDVENTSFRGGQMRLLKTLDLSPEQESQIRALVDAYRENNRGDRGARQKLISDVDMLLTPEQRLQMRRNQEDPRPTRSEPSHPFAHATATAEAQERYELAAHYSQEQEGLSLLILHQGRIVFEEYDSSAEEAYVLASGTKSFWGVLAAAAVADGLLDWEERVAETLTEWRDDPLKSRITVRQVLNFTDGLDPADQDLDGPTLKNKYQYAVDLQAVAEPGTTFCYGPSHLYVFGELMRRKLAADPLEYLEQRVFAPIDLRVSDWRRDGAGNPLMPAGASLTAREWAKFGELVRQGGSWQGRTVIASDALQSCFVGSAVNPAYGLTFWLNVAVPEGTFSTEVTEGEGRNPWRRGGSSGSIYLGAPEDLVMAAGAGKQRLYIMPSLELVVVRQGNRASKFREEGTKFRDDEFLALLLKGEPLTG